MNKVAFDFGGVLRRIYKGGLSEEELSRNHDAIRAMYELFIKSKDWKVYIVTKRPKDKDTLESVWKELDHHHISHPDKIYITLGSKQKILKELKPDLFFDDCDDHIVEALAEGITTFKVT